MPRVRLRSLPIVAALFATAPACTRVPASLDLQGDTGAAASSRTPERSAPQSTQDFDVDAALAGAERALLAVDELRDGHLEPDYDAMQSWLPDEGLRSLYYYATLANVSLWSMGSLFDAPVFLDGPHTDTLDYASDSFGRYNPQFVERVVATAEALGRDPARVERTRVAFDRQLRRQALTYLLVHRAIHHDPAWYARLEAAERDYASDPSAFLTVWDEIMPMNDGFADAGYSWYEAGTATTFWVRRDLDDTDGLWLAALEALLAAYGVDTSMQPPAYPGAGP